MKIQSFEEFLNENNISQDYTHNTILSYIYVLLNERLLKNNLYEIAADVLEYFNSSATNIIVVQEIHEMENQIDIINSIFNKIENEFTKKHTDQQCEFLSFEDCEIIKFSNIDEILRGTFYFLKKPFFNILLNDRKYSDQPDSYIRGFKPSFENLIVKIKEKEKEYADNFYTKTIDIIFQSIDNKDESVSADKFITRILTLKYKLLNTHSFMYFYNMLSPEKQHELRKYKMLNKYKNVI